MKRGRGGDRALATGVVHESDANDEWSSHDDSADNSSGSSDEVQNVSEEKLINEHVKMRMSSKPFRHMMPYRLPIPNTTTSARFLQEEKQ